MSGDEAQAPVDLLTTLAQVVASVTVGIMALDRDGRIIVVNKSALAMLGRSEAELVGAFAHTVFHGEAPETDGFCTFDVAARSRDSIEIEGDTFKAADGAVLPVSWVGSPLQDREGLAVVFRDDTARRTTMVVDAAEREQSRADLAGARQTVSDLEWVAEVTQILSSSLDDAEVLRRLARLLVGRLADVAIVDEVDDDGRLRRLGGAVSSALDVDLDALIARSDITHDIAADSTSVPTVLAGRVTRLDGAAISDPAVLGPSSVALLTALDAESVLIVPLAARERVVGVFVLVRQAGRAPFDDVEELMCIDVARRAALAVDNARLYRAQSEIALQLQHALLPQPSEQGAVQVAVRYLPARDRYGVGGDWYDLFHCSRNAERTVLVIGDVAGHDLRAATTMAAIRNLVRGIVVATDHSCAEVLDAVDDNLQTLGIVGTASTLVMTAEAADEGTWQLTWSNAGHLPPVLIEPDGAVSMLDEVHGPILGARMHVQRAQSTRSVPAGSTIVLYTDGLVERRGESIDASLVRLRQVVLSSTGLADQPGALLDALVTRNLTSDEDDTALLVCHLPRLPVSD